MLPRTHGSALFTRGETQALVTATLGTKEDEQRLELLRAAKPSSASCCTTTSRRSASAKSGFMRGPGRREIGHGALAERALIADAARTRRLPLHLRIVCDILESNGSVFDGHRLRRQLALMDAGVPIKAPVAGIAMGLVKEGDKYAILTDIAGAEDHYGDMDFKVAGTREGITALQMDIKVTGVTAADHEGSAGAGPPRPPVHPRQDGRGASPSRAPRCLAVRAAHLHHCTIPTDKIRDVIGPGGKVIRGIIEQTGVKIDVDDDGTVNMLRADGESAEEGPADDHRHHRRGRSRQDLPGQGGAPGRLRRLRRDLPRHRRPAAHQRNRREPHQGRARRTEAKATRSW